VVAEEGHHLQTMSEGEVVEAVVLKRKMEEAEAVVVVVLMKAAVLQSEVVEEVEAASMYGCSLRVEEEPVESSEAAEAVRFQLELWAAAAEGPRNANRCLGEVAVGEDHYRDLAAEEVQSRGSVAGEVLNVVR
jgi:hypothetical protein